MAASARIRRRWRTDSGKTPIIPEDVASSDVIRRVRSTDEAVMMPPTDERLTAGEIDVLTRWVEQGATTWASTTKDKSGFVAAEAHSRR
jgi:hypothetical protein